jgi:hypothetical protein
MLRLCSNDSSVLCRSVTPRRRTRGPCGLSLRPPTCLRFGSRCLRGLPVLVHEVSRRAWGLRLRRTEPELALAFRFIWPSANFYRVGVRVVSFRSSIAHPAYPLSTLHCVPHGSSARLEAKWIATPCLKGFFLLCFMPVYPGAQKSRLHSEPSTRLTPARRGALPFILGGILANTTQTQRNCGYEEAPIRVGDLSGHLGPS